MLLHIVKEDMEKMADCQKCRFSCKIYLKYTETNCVSMQQNTNENENRFFFSSEQKINGEKFT